MCPSVRCVPCDEEGRAEYVVTGSSDTRVAVWRHVIGSDTWTHAATLTGNTENTSQNTRPP